MKSISAELCGACESEKKYAIAATHVLCYMAKGIATKWRQAVSRLRNLPNEPLFCS